MSGGGVEAVVTPDVCPCDDRDSLCDYCAVCVKNGRGRINSIYAPDSISWCGPGHPLIAVYECEHGHEWSCNWAAEFYRELEGSNNGE